MSIKAYSRSSGDNIETLRVFATILLVSYHVIGPQADGGLGIDYPHPLRIFAQVMDDIRMPMFAMISGWVYAIRPPSRPALGMFVQGKIRRIILPGLVSSFLFWLTTQ